MYFMFGSNPDEVTKQYHLIIGKPVLTNQWALGWNQCKWGYKSLTELKEVVANFSRLDLPLDTQWSDIDYLNKYRDFEIDEDNFSGLDREVAAPLDDMWFVSRSPSSVLTNPVPEPAAVAQVVVSHA